jgi:putative DNA primase/helicase
VKDFNDRSRVDGPEAVKRDYETAEQYCPDGNAAHVLDEPSQEAPEDVSGSETKAGEGTQNNPPPNENPADTQAELARLAALSSFEYERERTEAAKRLGIRVAALDDEVNQRRAKAAESARADSILREPERWPDAVDGAALADELVKQLRRFTILPEHAAETAALWVIHAHAHDAAEHSPNLALQSAEMRCGKTTLLCTVADLVPRAMPAANISPAALFRAVEKYSPTLLIDEGDTFLRDNEEMRGILNSGLTRGSAYVIRCDGDDNDPKPFRTWCPKLIALIGKLPGTLQDRSIVVPLKRKLANERVERYGLKQSPVFHDLRSKCARWAFDHLDGLKSADPKMPDGLGDRAQDCWRPLLAIAEAIGGEWPAKAHKAAVSLSGVTPESNETASHRVLLLTHIREIFDDKIKGQTGEIGSQHLTEFLCEREDWPWGEWRHGKAISTRGVAMILGSHGIRAKHERTGNVYARGMFEDAWRRYLSHPLPEASPSSFTTFADAQKNSNNNPLGQSFASNSSFTHASTVKDKKSPKPHVSQCVKPPVKDVTVEIPGPAKRGNGAALPMASDTDFELF